ncbi:MAG: TetR family transcriptional regulator [Gordonia sp. (in: high G+C Gram-positive bacteria)]|uniref:TetR family transcriptional regulator n=1 Tax=Gordonia sp. (in: high G+C Gram-positive bacteria) TaxID=84139 RepID=UPI0039E3BE43
MASRSDSGGDARRRTRSDRGESGSGVSRAEKKEQTRQALLDTTIELVDDRSFGSISLREVARGAGIVPTAFYRHFASMEDLGVTLVEDSMRVLRRGLREARRDLPKGVLVPTARDSLRSLIKQVRADEAKFRFLVREQHGGVAEVRRAIDTELRLFSREVAIDMARVPALAGWDTEDLEVVAELFVTIMTSAVAELVDGDGRPDAESAIIRRTEKQLVLVVLGMGQWHGRE